MPLTNRGIIEMSEFTVNDSMAQIRYEVDEREIYNDIRSEIGILITDTVIATDPTYSYKHWHRTMLHAPGQTWIRMFTASQPNPTNWRLRWMSARDSDFNAYYDYDIYIEDTDDNRIKGVFSKNTGSKIATIKYTLEYKYKTAEAVTYEVQVPETLTVRATDGTSIRKYGRRVMNLTWSEGTSEDAMQSLVGNYLTKFKDPVARVKVTLKGITDVLRTQIITREISDLVRIVCSELGLYADCFIDSIAIREIPASGGIPICTWICKIQTTYDLKTIFVLDTSELDGPHILGS